MRSVLLKNKLNQGQLKLLKIICKSYNVSVEDTINRLIREYLKIHMPIFLEDAVLSTSAKLLDPDNNIRNYQVDATETEGYCCPYPGNLVSQLSNPCVTKNGIEMPLPNMVFQAAKVTKGYPKYSIDVDCLCDALNKNRDNNLLEKLYSSSKKISKDEQIRNIEDTINEISGN